MLKFLKYKLKQEKNSSRSTVGKYKAVAYHDTTFDTEGIFQEIAERGPYDRGALTGVWGDTFANGLCTFSGFVDVWYDKDVCGKLIVLSEPQFWFNLNKLKGMDDVNVSLGTEVEISNNFVFDSDGNSHKFYAIPTIAAKWTF